MDLGSQTMSSVKTLIKQQKNHLKVFFKLAIHLILNILNFQ